MNGSLVAGNCSDISNARNTTVCRQPASSVLFDGKTPTLTGLSGNMWANQLITLSSAEDESRSILLTFEFDSPEYTGVGEVQVTMFNCPDWGLAVRSIRLQNSGGENVLSSSRVLNSSCISLVTVMLCSRSRFTSSESRMLFDLQPNSDRVYIAELTFFPTVAICETADPNFSLGDATVSMQPGTTQASSTPGIIREATSTTRASTTTPADTIPSTTEIQTVHSNTSTPTEASSELNHFTIILAAALAGAFITACLLAAVLILWRCYCVKHHKHNTSHHPAVGEGHANTHSHPPPVTLCEETGQIYCSTPIAAEREDSPLEYSYVQRETLLMCERPKPLNSQSGEYDVIKEKSKGTLTPLACSITDTDKLEGKNAIVNETEKDNISSEPASHVYALPKRKDVEIPPDMGSSIAHVYSVLENQDIQQPQEVNVSTGHVYAVLENEDVHWQPEVDVSTGHIYAVLEREDTQTSEEAAVDNTLNNQLHTAVVVDATQPHTPEADIPVNQLYTRVDKKKKDGDTIRPHTPEAGSPVNQLYAQVDRKNKTRKGKEVCGDSLHD